MEGLQAHPACPQPPCLPPVSLETKHDDLGSVARPLTHSQVQVTVDLLILEEPYLPDLSSMLGQVKLSSAGPEQGRLEPTTKLEKSSITSGPGRPEPKRALASWRAPDCSHGNRVHGNRN